MSKRHAMAPADGRQGGSSEDARRNSHVNWLSYEQLVVLDTTLLIAAWGIVWTLRFEGTAWLDSPWRHTAAYHLVVSVPAWLAVFALFRLYRRVWTEASVHELKSLMIAVATGALANISLSVFLVPLLGLTPQRTPLSVIASGIMWSMCALLLPRLLARVWLLHRRQRRCSPTVQQVLILGAGASAKLAARELGEHPELGMRAIGILDDNASLHGAQVAGTPVLGALSELREQLDRHGIRQVIAALSHANGGTMRSIVQVCSEAGATLRIMPPVADILSGRVALSQLRPVQIQDLLRRAPVQTDLGTVRRTLGGQCVMVTGAGGSIGSELCRQIARTDPAELLLLGHGENSIFEIQQELQKTFPHVMLHCLIVDIRDASRIDDIFARFRPHTVFHAAAHKHVPLMEENLAEAITNNVKGTSTIVDAAVRHGVQRFVLISSDKAVNPSSIMGATKRIAELLVQRAAQSSGCRFVSVRFGNVLGSRGSVVPTFLRQIQAGGPITITHPDMQRYFMTIPEAVQLVLQAAVQGNGGEVFVLDMGEPVRILDLAQDLIRLSGFRVHDDVEIHFTGLRPGEKLFEEISRDDEMLQATEHPSVLRAQLGALPTGMARSVDDLVNLALDRADDRLLRAAIAELVPEYIALGTTHQTSDERSGLTLVA